MILINKRINLVFSIVFIGSLLHIASSESLKWRASFDPANCTVKMEQTLNVKVKLEILENDANQILDEKFSLISQNDLVSMSPLKLTHQNDGSYTGNFNLTGVFLGRSSVSVQFNGTTPPTVSDTKLSVIVIREVRIIDTIFTVSVATLVSILYINFGAALDMKKVKASFKRPIGPCLALFCHFLFLPLTSYFLGLWLFPNNVEMQLGLFFTGVSPAGGASNVWTVILGGNLDLSIAMTTTSTFAAFGMMPLWIFTLGKTIFDRGNLKVPYGQIASYAVALVVPLGIGLLIQKYSPRCTRFLVRIIKGFSSLLIIFIIVFGIVTNLYLFKLFTWQIFVAGIALPWFGYFAGWLTAVIFRQEYENRLAIAVEGGIQNTGIAIFILRFALSQPEADLTTVLPVAVAIMTPFPLLAYFLCYKGRECFRRRHERSLPPEAKHCVETQGNTSGTF